MKYEDNIGCRNAANVILLLFLKVVATSLCNKNYINTFMIHPKNS